LRSLSKPARVLLISTTAAATLFTAYLAYNQSHEPYAILFSQLEQDDAAGAVAKLKEMKTPYRLQAGGSTIEVPESRVGETRLELASAGLPRGGGVGFESFDKMRLGATEFEQRVLYRRALEGELARTIGTLGAVQSARVHLVLPEKSIFVTRNEPASASIVLRLRSGRALGGSEVAAIVHLTAASVPALTPDRVALVTTDGVLLRRPHVTAEGATAEGEEDRGSQQRAVEVQLEDRARAMLEKVVGTGHADVRVTAELDPAHVEHSEDHYDPTTAVLRSEESSVERAALGADDSVAGVPGAESNLPGGAAVGMLAKALTTPSRGDAGAPNPGVPVAKAGGEQPFHETHTRNFEVDHVSDKRIVSPGSLKRITVAAVLDGVVRTEGGQKKVVPLDRAELERLGVLVRSAVGAKDSRGDVVTVDSMPFAEGTTSLEAADVVPALTPAKPLRAYIAAASAAGLLLLLLAAGSTVVARRRSRVRRATQLLAPAFAPQQLAAAPVPIDLRAAAMARAASDPATAALVLRAWLETTNTEVNAPVARS
jgi:flagellar M-ring protein FliF